ncbi:MAG: 23S rRNA (pseudouridine(1915)-N(3))-methyltransferase RlmH [Erysipelotrichaceae bacterium]|nr:23S rRNA (pseudouridine(1915)-N(3))-methyltransferase RlmH [Erysipelotrichaceae bacterium]
MIRIICVGKVKESFYREAILEYMKRMSKYHKILIEEVSDSNIEQEKELILKKIDKRDYIVTLEIEGNQLNSLEFSEMIDKTFLNYSVITFIIGGSNGLSDEIKKLANYKLSFSKLTFPHQLFRVILLEQIYRAFKILHHESYHK